MKLTLTFFILWGGRKFFPKNTKNEHEMKSISPCTSTYFLSLINYDHTEKLFFRSFHILLSKSLKSKE